VSAWIVFLIVIIPLLGLLAWIASSDSLINIPPGRIGLLMINGRATDKVVQPGLHWVPRLRRRLVAEYPSLELSFRAHGEDSAAEPTDTERSGPTLSVTLGDRTQATLSYTVRFRLDEDRLKTIHERFGPEGFWSAVRDVSAQALRWRVIEPGVSVDDLFGTGWRELERHVAESVKATLDDHGLIVTMFSIDGTDLGRTGEVIQSTVRARLELEREEAESSLRMARARIDSELEPYLVTMSDAALRYREVDVWRDLVHTQSERAVPRVPGRPIVAITSADQVDQVTQGEPGSIVPSSDEM
jgi:regulator of protease activity HflC (stomatin/prohibitin superfamily)